jgi:hypothetical protein
VKALLEAFERRIDALHDSSYKHLTKTTLPEFARRLDALEACATPDPATNIDNVTHARDPPTSNDSTRAATPPIDTTA